MIKYLFGQNVIKRRNPMTDETIPKNLSDPYYKKIGDLRLVLSDVFEATENKFFQFTHMGNKVIASKYNEKHLKNRNRQIIPTESNQDFETQLINFIDNSSANMVGLTIRIQNCIDAHLTPIVVEKKNGEIHVFISDSIGKYTEALKLILSIRRKNKNLNLKIHLSETNLPNEKGKISNYRQASDGPCFSDCFYYLQRALRLDSLVDIASRKNLPENHQILAEHYNLMYSGIPETPDGKLRKILAVDEINDEFKKQLIEFTNIKCSVMGLSVASTSKITTVVPVIIEKNGDNITVTVSNDESLSRYNESILNEIQLILPKQNLTIRKVKMDLQNKNAIGNSPFTHLSVVKYLQRAFSLDSISEDMDDKIKATNQDDIDFDTFNEPADLALTAEMSGFLNTNKIKDDEALKVYTKKEKKFVEKSGGKEDVERFDTSNRLSKKTFKERTFLQKLNQKHGKWVEAHIRQESVKSQDRNNEQIKTGDDAKPQGTSTSTTVPNTNKSTPSPKAPVKILTTQKHIQLLNYFKRKWDTCKNLNDFERIIHLLKAYSRYQKISIYRLTRNHVDKVNGFINDYASKKLDQDQLKDKLVAFKQELKNPEGTLAALIHFVEQKINSQSLTPLSIGDSINVVDNITSDGNSLKYFSYGKR